VADAAPAGLAVSGLGLAVAACVSASAAGGLTVSGEGLTAAAGSVTDAACVAACLRGWADGRVG